MLALDFKRAGVQFGALKVYITEKKEKLATTSSNFVLHSRFPLTTIDDGLPSLVHPLDFKGWAIRSLSAESDLKYR